MCFMQRKRKKIVLGGKTKDRERGRLIRVEGLKTKTTKQQKKGGRVCRWKGQRYIKRKTVPGGRVKDR